MTSRQKGNAFELKIKKYLENLGYKVEKANARILWIKNKTGDLKPVSLHHDFFEVADLIAIHPAYDKTRFIQASLDEGNVAVKKHKGEAFPWNHVAQEYEVWTKSHERGKFRIFRLVKQLDGLLTWLDTTVK